MINPLTSNHRAVLRAYCGESGNVQTSGNLGSMVLGDIYSLRPADCRFAIVEIDRRFYAVDLFDANIDQNSWLMFLDSPNFPTVEAAIMAAVLKP